nr:MAG TPA: hypothetical protein [Herelleviridae sp.]
MEDRISMLQVLQPDQSVDSPVYPPVNLLRIWLAPVNIGIVKQCAACLTS